MREFSAEYLATTRQGMWTDSREALADLELSSRERVLDVGCGTGELTRVLAEETDGRVVGADADPSLLAVAREALADDGGDGDDGDGDGDDGDDTSVVAADATRLPFRDDAFDLVVCQALLIHVPDPAVALREFARVSSDLAAVVEPDNAAVTVESTVGAEPDLSMRARRRFLEGFETDPTLGTDARAAFAEAEVDVVSTRRYDHERVVEPPYTELDLEDARRKARGAGLESDRETMLAGDTSPEEFERLRREWRSMGREVVDQMADREYVRTETVPFFVTVGRVP